MLSVIAASGIVLSAQGPLASLVHTPEIVPTASAQVAACMNKLSVQDSYAIAAAKNEIYFHRTIHKTDLNDWASVKDNQPWGTADITDMDITELPKGLANPTVPTALLASGNNAYIHYNLLDQANGNWQSFNANKPWGNSNLVAVGIAGHPNDTSIRAVVATTDKVFFIWSAIRDNPYGSYVWADVTDNKPWGTAAIQDVDITNENRLMVLAGGVVYILHTPTNLGADNWALAKNPGPATERIDWEFRPAIASKGSDVAYIYWPDGAAANTSAWYLINDNKPWGTTHVDDVSVFFWLQEEPWRTPAIASIAAGNKFYLHWHPDTANNAALTGPENDWVDASDNAPWSLPGAVCNPTSDIYLSKTAPLSVVQGQGIQYTLTVTNNSTADATNVVVTDAVPAGLTFATNTGNVNCSLQGNNVVCNVGNVTRGNPVSFNLAFNMNSNQACGTTSNITNTATVTSTPAPANATNATSTITTNVACPSGNLSIVKSGADTVVRGNQMTYIINVLNNGPSTATNVVVTDPIPSGLTYASNDAGCGVQGNNVVCNLGSMTNGQAKSVSIVYNVPTINNCSGTTTIQNRATVSADNDNDTTNNQSSNVFTTVQCNTTSSSSSSTSSVTSSSISSSVSSQSTTSSTSSVSSGSGNCADARDNDTDGLIDANDPDCHTDGNPNNSNSFDRNRNETTNNGGTCADARDNDSDAMIDAADPDCHTDGNPNNSNSYDRTRNEIYNNGGNCADGRDNEGDNLIDAVDPDCHTDANPNNSNSYDRNRSETTVNSGGSSSSSSRKNVDDDDLEITVEASASEVFPGGSFECSIMVENDTGEDLEDLIITASFDEDDVTVTDDGDADDEDDEELIWEIGDLDDGDDDEVSFRLKVRNDVSPGSTVTCDAEVVAKDGTSNDDDVEVRVIGTLPQTGFNVGTLGGSTSFLKPVTASSTSSGGMPMAVWMALAMGGIGAGGFFGRRFFI